MRLYILLCLMFVSFIAGNAQLPAGYLTGKYAGVHAVTQNPALLNTNGYRFHVNLFNVNSFLGNDQASFNLKNIGNLSSDYFEDNFYGENSGLTSGMFNIDLLGPAVQFNIGKKNSFAVFSRARVMGNFKELDGKLVHSISKDFETDPSLPYSFNSNANMQIALNGWAEFGASFSRQIYSNNQHSFTAGISLKYLSGAGTGYLQLKNLNGTIQEDAVLNDYYLENTSGTIGTGFSGISFNDFSLNEILDNSGSGMGADLGIVYEYRGGKEKGYKLKAALGITDVGSIKYRKDPARSGTYTIDITGSEKFYLSELDNTSLDNYKDVFDNNPQHFTPAADNIDTEINYVLPTSFNLALDYQLASKFFIGLHTRLPMNKADSKPFLNKYYAEFGLTPRFETRIFGAGVPLSYNGLTGFNAGVYLYAGPLFVSSRNILSAVAGETRQADFSIGISFGKKK